MNYRPHLSAALILPLMSTLALATSLAFAQPYGESAEPMPEELDAAFTAEDAAREAALRSDVIIERKPPDPIARMSAESDLVIRGTVTAQEIVYDEKDLPLTQTTLSIAEVLQGEFADDQITIVQEGGPSKRNPDKVMMVSDAHYFTVGAEEVLFLGLDPNSPYITRKVAINWRLGVQNGKLFDENGRGLLYSETANQPGYRLGWSNNRNPHSRFHDFTIGPHEFSKQFSDDEESDMDSGGDESTQQLRSVNPGYQASMNINTLRNALSR